MLYQVIPGTYSLEAVDHFLRLRTFPYLPQACVQVADFNLSRILEGTALLSSLTTSTAGGANNPRWLAPEVLSTQRYTAAADVFAFGVIM